MVPMRVGILGCGMIARQYATNAPVFDAFEIVACADTSQAAGASLAAKHGFAAVTVDELIADPDVDIVLNLTPPAHHATAVRQALAAGKHVYSEKPLATTVDDARALVAEAEQRGLRVGCAPDTFLGAPYQAARVLIDDGAIGVPLAVDAAMFTGGQAEWHPNPDIFFMDGAGPLLDMGPYYLTAIVALLGSIRRVAAFSSTLVAERVIQIGPRAGEVFRPGTPTHTVAILQLEDGPTANFHASFEAPGQYVSTLSIYGTEGILALPDPNTFDGPVRLRRGTGEWQEVALPARAVHAARGIGLHELVTAIEEGRPHRASDRLALHVVEVARTILDAAATGTNLDVSTNVRRPAVMPLGVAEG